MTRRAPLPRSFGFAEGALAGQAVLDVRDRMIAKPR
jgi:hypothetical protein